MSPYPKLFSLVAALLLVVFMQGATLCAQESKLRHTYGTSFYYYSRERADVPVLYYTCSRGHHGGYMLDDPEIVENILIWKDGTIAWCIAPKGKRHDLQWYQSIVPPERVETALQEITTDFKKYPAQYRPRQSGIFFRLGAAYSPTITVHSPQHYESLWVDHLLWKFYKENREVLQSDDQEAILKTIKTVGGFPPGIINPDGTYTGLHPAYKFDYRGLAEYYGEKRSYAELSEKRSPDYSDEEILKCVALYTADVGHLCLMEEKILDLLPSHEGLKARKLNKQMYNIHVEREIKDGKSEFFYSQISEKETEKIWKKMREKRAQK